MTNIKMTNIEMTNIKTIKSCVYGKDNKYVDVTDIVKHQLQSCGKVDVNNTSFKCDPIYGVKKELIVNMETVSNGVTTTTKVVIDEGDTYHNSEYMNTASKPIVGLGVSDLSDKLKDIKLTTTNQVVIKCYYHIFCTKDPITLQVVDEQLDTICNSTFYDRFDVINCCVTGNDLNHYNMVMDKLVIRCGNSNGKIKIHKSVFGDTSYERYTLNSIRDDPDLNSNDTFILYIHSKGVTRSDIPAFVTTWRKCLMYFLATNAEVCIDKFMKHPYDTVSIFHVPHGKMSPDGAYYAGNFWWARGTYLKRLFSKHIIGPKYYDTEQFLFKDKPNFCNLYEWNWNFKPIEPQQYLKKKLQ